MEQTDKGTGATQERFSFSNDMRVWQQQLVQGVLRALVIIAPLAAVAGSYYDYTRQIYSTIPLYWGAYGILLLIAFWRRVPYTVQAGVIMLLIYGLAVLDFLSDGRGGSGRLFLLVIPFMAGIFLGARASVISLLVVLGTMVGLGWAFSTSFVTISREVNSADAAGWASNTLVLAMLGAFVVVAQNRIVPRLAIALRRSQQLAEELEEQRSQLQVQVEKRTADLARRSAQLQTSAQIARDATAIRDVDTLLVEVVHLVSERFGFYHTGIFMLDEAKEYAVLRSASSEGGQRMLAQGHRLPVGQTGIVGHVTRWGKSRIALDVGKDAIFFDNPNLPETRSEVALPLQIRGEIIGALDVQSIEPEAFDEEDVAVLQTLADQVAIAISNARLYQQSQESLEAERRAYAEISLKAWQELTHVRPDLEQRYDPQRILPGDGRWREEMKRAVREGKPVAGENGSESAGSRTAALAVPLKIRDRVIGVLDAHKPPEAGEWTAEETALLQALTDQLGVALDSARLYQDTQRRAGREQLIATSAARMRESLNVDTVLRTATQELRQALGLSKLTVRLATRTLDPGVVKEE
jgi:GAF domain-containing protein